MYQHKTSSNSRQVPVLLQTKIKPSKNVSELENTVAEQQKQLEHLRREINRIKQSISAINLYLRQK